jgi:glutaminase
MHLPLQIFLDKCHQNFLADKSGALASYIPELSNANPDHFGISLATIDGHVYDIGDSTAPFTIQSVSKAYVFATALELVGIEKVENTIGVEPSGEAFNSIRLNAQNRPFNPMVNAGAIACSGLVYEKFGSEAFDLIRNMLGKFAARELDIDQKVFESERRTGDRNRAIAWLLRNYGGLPEHVDNVLDVYFQQCSLNVTSRDLAVMGATLANGGVNPITNEQVVNQNNVARTLAVMTSSGMYDYAGEWAYRVGMPAKSGVGGGIVAALPGQLGVGVFSPLLDDHGNSVRGLKVCESLSSQFDLHMLNVSADVRTSVFANYDLKNISSRRSRSPEEQRIIEQHHKDVRILELVGSLAFSSVDYISRKIADFKSPPQIVILDFRRVPNITLAAARLLVDCLSNLRKQSNTLITLTGLEASSKIWETLQQAQDDFPQVRRFPSIEEGIEWAEDQIVYRYGGYSQSPKPVELERFRLTSGLGAEALQELSKLINERTFNAGEQIIKAETEADAIYFLQSGMVSVKLPTGVRLATLSPGKEFGELALLDSKRSADIWADTKVQCLELPLSSYAYLKGRHPEISERISHNLAAILAERLVFANTKINILSGR